MAWCLQSNFDTFWNEWFTLERLDVTGFLSHFITETLNNFNSSYSKNWFFVSFNRTILELKFDLTKFQSGGNYAFNRTILELKFFCVDCVCNRLWLLIEPYWNWNTISATSLINSFALLIAPNWNWNRPTSGYNGYQMSLLIAPNWNWNFNIMPLKVGGGSLLIEPYWNWNEPPCL